MIFNALATIFSKFFFFCGYYSSGNAYPKPLPPQEEAECLKKMAEGDEAAKERLIRHNMRLVAHVAKKYAQKQKDKGNDYEYCMLGYGRRSGA